MYPERGEHLIRKYGPEDDVIAAKRENLVEFQKRMRLNVNPEANLLCWPSRLDPSQKGIELLEAIANPFVVFHVNRYAAFSNARSNVSSDLPVSGPR